MIPEDNEMLEAAVAEGEQLVMEELEHYGNLDIEDFEDMSEDEDEDPDMSMSEEEEEEEVEEEGEEEEEEEDQVMYEDYDSDEEFDIPGPVANEIEMLAHLTFEQFLLVIRTVFQ